MIRIQAFFGIIFIAVHLLHPEASRLFWSDSSLWVEPVLASSLCGLLCAMTGLYLLMNQMVFASLAMTQASGLGIFVSFAILSLLTPWEVAVHSLPLFCGISFGFIMILFYMKVRSHREQREMLTGLLYTSAAAMILLIGDRVAEGRHEIEDFLFGNAVAIGHHDFQILTVIGIIIGIIYLVGHKHFVAVSIDPDFYQVSAYPRKKTTLCLYLALAGTVTLSMKTLGQLPILGFLIFPAAIAVRTSRSLRTTILTALSIGLWMGPLGYYLSYIYSFPTGAMMVLVGTTAWGLSLLKKN